MINAHSLRSIVLRLVAASLLSNFSYVLAVLFFTSFSIFGIPRSPIVDVLLLLWSNAMYIIAFFLYAMHNLQFTSRHLIMIMTYAFASHILMFFYAWYMTGYWLFLYFTITSSMGLVVYGVTEYLNYKQKNL
ncbi:MAG: hypothetical protein VXY77_05005 [Pseudomonadota bacterium]|nr:hypothetical protein [Pseudomonadota bacterium]